MGRISVEQGPSLARKQHLPQCTDQPVYSGMSNPDPKRQLTHVLGHQIGSPV